MGTDQLEKNMAITKTTITDKIEVVGPYRSVQVRECDIFAEDGVKISQGDFHRHVVDCQQRNPDTGDWGDTDVSGECEEVQQICESGIWTEAIKEAYRESQPPNPLAAEAAAEEAAAAG